MHGIGMFLEQTRWGVVRRLNYQMVISLPTCFPLFTNHNDMEQHACTYLYVYFSLNIFIAVVHVYTDKACTDIDGQCQDDHLICSGSYYSGKCTGSTTRRCCTNNPVGNVHVLFVNINLNE